MFKKCLFSCITVAITVLFVACDWNTNDDYWATCYGQLDFEFAMGIVPTTDGGIIAGAASNLGDFSNPSYGTLLVKHNINGDILWQFGYDQSYLRSMSVDNGKITLCADILMQTDENGQLLTAKKIMQNDSTGPVNAYVYSSAVLKNGNTVVTCITANQDIKNDRGGVVAFNPAGEVVWNRAYDGVTYKRFTLNNIPRIVALSNGDFATVETTNDPAYEEHKHYGIMYETIWAKRYTANGDLVWQKAFGGSIEKNSVIKETLDGGLIICGETNGLVFGETDALVIKLDINGNMVWAKNYGYNDTTDPNFDSSGEKANDITINSDGTYIVTGLTTHLCKVRNGINSWNLKLDANGNAVWAKIYLAKDQMISCNIIKSINGYFMVGETYDYQASGNWDLVVSSVNLNGEIPGNTTSIKSELPYANNLMGILHVKDTDAVLFTPAISVENVSNVTRTSRSVSVRY